MKKIKYRISLDMLEVASQTTIKVKKGDTACSILITLTENGKIYHISEGCLAVFSAKKADGNYIFNSETCSIVDNTIVYDFTKQTVACEGIAECEVILYKGEEKLTSPRFDMVVDNTVYNGEEIVSSPEADALNDLIDEATDVIGEANELVADIGKKLENGDFNGKDADTSLISNALKGNKSGEIVSMTDVSPIEHNVGVKVKSKNLFNGVLKDSVFSWGPSPIYKRIEIYLTKGTYTVSFSTQIMMQSTNITISAQRFTTNTFTVNEDKEYYMQFRIDVEPNVNWDDSITIQLEEGATATAYTPYVEDLTAVGVKKLGGNLWNHEYDKKDLSNCTAWATVIWNNEAVKKVFKPNTTYKIKYTATCLKTVEGASKNSNNLGFNLYGNGNSYPLGYSYANNIGKMIATKGESITIEDAFTTPANLDGLEVIAYTQVYKTTESSWLEGTFSFDNIMLQVGTIATEYEPYIEPTTYTPNENGIVEGVTSLYPSMTLTSDSGVIIDAEYNRDINKAFAELQNAVINMGGTL